MSGSNEILACNVGRREEFERLCVNIERERPTIVLGRGGIGKTHLLYRAMAWLKKKYGKRRKIVYLDDLSQGEKHVLFLIYLSLHPFAAERGARPRSDATLADLERLIIDTLAQYYPHGDVIFFVDGLDGIGKRTVRVWNKLYGLTLIVGAAQSRNVSRHVRGHILKYEPLTLRPLSEDDSRRLAGWYWRKLKEKGSVKSEPDERSERHLIRRVVRQTNGNPLAIIETLKNVRGFDRITFRSLREMSVHEGGIIYSDGVGHIISFFAGAVILRFFYRGIYLFDISNIMAIAMGCFLVIGPFVRRRMGKPEAA